MTIPSERFTQRLVLTPATTSDLNDFAEVHADERVWCHRPEGRHTSVEYSRAKLLEIEQQWVTDGLSYWIVRLRQPVGPLKAGSFVGVGGCAVDPKHGWWNLYYRFRPEAQGHRLAVELSLAALESAHAVDPGRPIVATLVETNHASKITAERAGLRLQRSDPDPDHPDTNRLIYADRSLADPPHDR